MERVFIILDVLPAILFHVTSVNSVLSVKIQDFLKTGPKVAFSMKLRGYVHVRAAVSFQRKWSTPVVKGRLAIPD